MRTYIRSRRYRKLKAYALPHMRKRSRVSGTGKRSCLNPHAHGKALAMTSWHNVFVNVPVTLQIESVFDPKLNSYKLTASEQIILLFWRVERLCDWRCGSFDPTSPTEGLGDSTSRKNTSSGGGEQITRSLNRKWFWFIWQLRGDCICHSSNLCKFILS